MYDYVDGKVDWMAHGLPVTGERGPYVSSALVEVTTCRPDEHPADVAERVQDRAVVISCDGMAVGKVDGSRLRDAADGQTVLEVMDVMPDTIRPSVPLGDVDERTAGRLVTTSDGVLLGAIDPSAVEQGHDEVRARLRQELIDHGHTAEEADQLLEEAGS